MSDDSKDCLQCRLISGGGLMAAGTYMTYHSKGLKPFSRYVVTSIGYGLGVLGLLRVLALPPFAKISHVDEKPVVEHNEEEEYIIGKFPSKFR